jgi:hypothetical protein
MLGMLIRRVKCHIDGPAAAQPSSKFPLRLWLAKPGLIQRREHSAAYTI